MGLCTATLEANCDQMVSGNKRERVALVSPSATYATGGDTLTAAQFGLNVLENVEVNVDNAGTRFGAWDKANGKLKVYTALGTEAVNATNQSAIVFRVEVLGY